MYRIGPFARLGGVSAKTLRYYDEIGLLRPVRTDPVTGYRCYAPEQLRDLAAIVSLKELGLSLAEVMALPKVNRRATLERARARLTRTMLRTRASLDSIERWLAHRPGSSDPVPVVVKQRAAMRVASLGGALAGYEDVAHAEQELWDRLPAQARVALRGVVWHRCANDGTPLGEPFVELTEGRKAAWDGLHVRDLPAVVVACAYAADDFQAAELAYDGIRDWMGARQYALAGPKRELYHGAVLEIQFPLST